MKKQYDSRKLEQQWERAVEQAQQDSTRAQPVSDEMLDSAAGLEIKSGVRSGYWTQSYSCKGGCTGGMC